VPGLLAGADLPSTSKGFRDFRVRKDPTGVKVVVDIVEAAIVEQAIQKVANLLLSFHVCHLDLKRRS